MFLEEILGNKVRVKVLRTLFERSTAFTREELEEETGLSAGAVHRALKDLKRNGVVAELKGEGKKQFYKIKKENGNPIVKPLSDLFDQEAFSGRKGSVPAYHWNLLAEVVKYLGKHLLDELSQIILFGSVARGEAIPSSDIDLLIVLKETPGEKIQEGIRSKLDEKWDANFSLILRSSEKLEEMRGKETALFEEVQRDGIVLYREEDASEVIG